MNELAIQCGGVLSAIVGIGHCFFYRGFGWSEDFEKTRKLTSKVLYTIHLFLIPLFLFFAYISIVHTEDLAGRTRLGTTIASFYSIFWLVRGLWQIFYFRPADLPASRKLVPLHYGLIVLFFALCLAYAVPVLNRA